MKTFVRISLLAAILFPLIACATTPPILGTDGKPLPGSLATLEQVTLNGRKEWVTIRGADQTAPVLLFLAGGPGGTELATVRRTLGGLEDHFLVVVWDQPGAGKSFSAIDHGDLELQTYIDDALALMDLLCRRFGRSKLYLMGESWGSALALLVSARRPDLVDACFGTGQMVGFLENDIACYDFALSWARDKGDVKEEEKLVKQGPPPYYGRGSGGKQTAYLLDTFAYMREVKGVRSNGDTMGDIMSPEYNLVDKLHWLLGLLYTLDKFYPKLWGLDLRQAVPRLEVPVYFLVGRHDVNASIPLLLDYFSKLEAPAKEIVWFERSGHTPWSSEPELFVGEVVARIGRN
jgi:pimeloyl-ACP methyl ester carboxylesterase